MNIFAYNPDLSDAERTNLMSAIAATPTTTVLKVKNSDRFTNSRRVLIGTPARERSEMSTQSAKTPTTITVGTTNFSHDADDPVIALDVDQTKFYRSTAGVNGSYNLLATVDIDWDNANGKTTYNDPNALDSYFYKVSHYDSIGAIETALSPPIQATGYPDNSVGETLMQVLKELNDEEFTVYDIPAWLGIMDNVSKDLYKQAKKPYRFLKTKTTIDVETDDNSFPWPDDLWKINYVEVNQYNGGVTPLRFTLKKIDNQTMRFRQSRMILPSDYVNELAYDDEDKTVLFNPAARTDRLGAFIFHYYKKFTKFVDLSSLLETPDNLVYMYGMKRQFYLRRMDDDNKYATQMQMYDKMYQAEIRMLQREKNIDVHAPIAMGPDKKTYPQWGGVRYRQ